MTSSIAHLPADHAPRVLLIESRAVAGREESVSLTAAFDVPTRSASAAVQAGTYSVTVRARNTCGLLPPTPVQVVSVP
jgi:hypothetical protein